MSATDSLFSHRRTTAERTAQRLRFGFKRELPMEMQSTAGESGLACLAMVAGFHGHLTDMNSLRARHGVSAKGATAQSIIEIGSALHLEGHAVRVSRRELAKLKLPCVLHWDASHFVVLKKVLPGRTGIVIHDPAVGEVRVKRSAIAKRFTDIVALEFTPTASFRQQDTPKPVGLMSVIGHVTGLKRAALQIMLLALALQAFALATPLFAQWAVDSGVTLADRGLVITLAIGFALFASVQAVIGLMRSWMVLYTVSHLNLQWLTNVFTHVLRLPTSYFDKRGLGDLASRFQSIGAIQESMGTSFVEALLDGALALAVLGVMFVYSAPLALAVLGFALAYAALRWATFGALKHATRQQLALAAREQSLFLESVQNMAAIKLFNHESERRGRWLDAVVESMNRQLVGQKLVLGLNCARTLILGAEIATVVWLCAGLAMDNLLSIGMLFALASYKTTFTQRFYALIDKCVDLALLRVKAERLADIVHAPVERNQASRSLPNDSTLEVRDVWFRYAATEPWVLRNVSLVFRPGEAVAIVGASGSGKSTLVKVMLGLLKPEHGQVLFGGVPIEQLNSREYRGVVGAVLQEEALLAGSLLENISFFAEKPSLERAVISAAGAALHEDIERMPLGYHTLVGGLGSSVSAGQKQRILLARALYKRPRLLFLDEATSHVDARSERVINESLATLQFTRIVVAHRPETTRGVPRVVVIENGTVAKDLSSVVTVTEAVTMAVNDSTVISLPAPSPKLSRV